MQLPACDGCGKALELTVGGQCRNCGSDYSLTLVRPNGDEPRTHSLARLFDPDDVLAWEPLSDIETRSIVWVDRPLWQASAFHLLVGRKGVGKGTMQADHAARVTRGELGSRQNVVWIASEDSASIDIKPRLLAAGGLPDRVKIIKDWPQLPGDIEKLRNTMALIGDVGLLIIDPVGNHITGKNSNSDTDIRDAIAPLNGLADEHEAMVVGVRHLTEKEAQNGAIAAILGASAWVQVPRAVLAIVRDNDESSVSHIQCIAGNRLPPDTPGRAFRIEGVLLDGLENEITRAIWIGDSTKDVGTLLGETRKPGSKSGAARDAILDALEAAPVQRMESDALDAQVAREIGLNVKTVKNIRGELKGEGLLRPVPQKDELGHVEKWFVERTNAPRPETGSGSGYPHPDSSRRTDVFGSNAPDPVQSPRHSLTGSGKKDSRHPESVGTGDLGAPSVPISMFDPSAPDEVLA